MLSKTKTIHPNILVLEGLWDDTSKALRAAGARVEEESPWTFIDAEQDLKDGYYDGLVLTGGSDICPSLYDEKPAPRTQSPDKMRDFEEYRALTIALDLGIPVLGICRGSQIINAFRGGTLKQDISGHTNHEHPVYAAVDCSTFKRAIGGRTMSVTSLHHQCVSTVGPDMRIAAYGHDGTPEAVESKDGLWLGVQFHPELAAFDNGNAFAIFQWLVRKAAEHAGGGSPRTVFREVKAAIERVRAVKSEEARQANAQKQLMAAACAPKQLSPPKKARKAGEPSIPSMRSSHDEGPTMAELELIAARSMSRSAEAVHLESELQTCMRCGLLFDHEMDRVDHELYVCGVTYADGPPAGHPAWDIH